MGFYYRYTIKSNILPAIEALIQQGSINTEKLQELGLLNDNQIQMLNKLIETGVETNQILDMVLQLAKEISKNKEVEISKINGIETITLKGEKGDTPEKGKDYFTDEDITEIKNGIKDEVTPEKGKDYFTDEEVKSFLNKITPIKGKDYFDGEQGPQGPEGKQGKQGQQGPQGDTGINGRNGKDGEDGRDGSPDTPEQIVSKLNTVEKVVDWKVLKNVPDLFKKGGYGIMVMVMSVWYYGIICQYGYGIMVS